MAQVSDSDSNDYNLGFYSGASQEGCNWSLPSEFTSQDGTLYYVCEPHASMNMRGSIIVGSGSLPLPEISMEFSDFPWLSYILVFPLIGALCSISFSNTPNAPRLLALFTNFIPLVISLIVFMKTGSKSGYSLMEEYEWAPNLGISLLLGVDGLSSPLILLTGIIGPLTVIFAWEEKEKPGLFFSLLLVMQTALYGVFVTLDYFVFYVFWEIVLIPMFFLIAIWGGENRRYASIKFFIYTFTASVIMLVGFMALYFEAGVNSFSMIDIAYVEWLELGFRWLHLIAGIAWIGSSFYFMFLDYSLRPDENLPAGVKGASWNVHGGGFYFMQKYTVAPEKMPDVLHWFKWEAYFTWISGILLLSVIYYFNASTYLLSSDSSLNPSYGVALSLLGLIVI